MLRPYQASLEEATREAFRRGRRRVLVQLPTGGGKTTIAASMIRGAVARGRRCLFLAHRKELIVQAADRLEQHGVACGILMGNHPRASSRAPVQVASVQTLRRRAAIPPADFVFVDECHRTLGASYLWVLEQLPSAWVVGLSATPYRQDGRGLGEVYEELVQGPGIEQLTSDGFLVPVEIYAPELGTMLGRPKGTDWSEAELEEKLNRRALVGDLVEHWRERAAGRPTVAFAVSRAHSEAIARQFREAGIEARHLDGSTPADERAGMLRDLAAGRIQVVSNCAVLTEGWDSPPVSCAILARPTLSRSLWIQMAGRVLRTHPGKAGAIILDHGGCARLHGHLYDEQPVSLEGLAQEVRRAARAGHVQTSTCPSCYGVLLRRDLGQARACPYCKERIPEDRRKPVRQRAGTLEKVGRGAGPLIRNFGWHQAEAKAAELFREAARKGYQAGWVVYKLRAMYGEAVTATLLATRRGAA